jgi:hypothetical protein
MKKISIIFSVVLFAAIGSFIYGNITQEKIDYVPDKETAKKAAAPYGFFPATIARTTKYRML